MSSGPKEAASHYSSACNLALAMFVVFLVFPLLIGLVCLVFGALLAWAEDWGVGDGFYYIISNLCGLANPHTDASPTTGGGKAAAVYVALVSISFFAAVITLVGYFSMWSTLMRRFEGLAHFHVTKSSHQDSEGHAEHDDHNKPWVVHFENGQKHRYTSKQLQEKCGVTDIQAGKAVQHKLRGPGIARVNETTHQDFQASDSDSPGTIATLQREVVLLRDRLASLAPTPELSYSPKVLQVLMAEENMEVRCDFVHGHACVCMHA